MDRGETGRYEVTTIGGEEVRAFIPYPCLSGRIARKAPKCPPERENRRAPASPQGPTPAATTVGFGARPTMPGPAAVVIDGRRSANLYMFPPDRPDRSVLAASAGAGAWR